MLRGSNARLVETTHRSLFLYSFAALRYRSFRYSRVRSATLPSRPSPFFKKYDLTTREESEPSRYTPIPYLNSCSMSCARRASRVRGGADAAFEEEDENEDEDEE